MFIVAEEVLLSAQDEVEWKKIGRIDKVVMAVTRERFEVVSRALFLSLGR